MIVCKFILCLIPVAGVMVCRQQQTPPNGSLAAQYERLEKLDLKILKEGADMATFEQLRAISDFFVSRGPEAARFLLARLREMNSAEEDFLKGSDDPMKGMEYLFSLMDRGGAPLLKYDTAHLLAELFPHVTQDLQSEILETIAASYLPSDYSGGMAYLDHALVRTGPASIPIFLKLADRPSERVRCDVARLLEDLHDPGVVVSRYKPYKRPPKLRCSGSSQQRRVAIEAWRKWWDTYGKNLPFPQFPSFFEIYESFKDRIPAPSPKD